MWVDCQRHAPAALTSEKDMVLILQVARWAAGRVWISAESLVPTAIRSLELPDHSESLYQLHYPSPRK